MRHTRLHKALAVVTAMGMIAATPIAALAVEQIIVEGTYGNDTYDAVSNTEGKTGIIMIDGGSSGLALNGDVTVKGDVTVTNENSSSSTASDMVTGVDIDSSSDEAYAKLDIKGSVNINATNGSENPEVEGINTEVKSDITIGGDVTANANGYATGVIANSYGTTIDIGGSVIVKSEDYFANGITVDLYGVTLQGENDYAKIDIGGNVTVSGDDGVSGVEVGGNNGSVKLDVGGNITATSGDDSTAVRIYSNHGKIDIKVDGDIQSTGDAIYISGIDENATAKITAGGNVSAENGHAIYVDTDGVKEIEPEITVWKIESTGSLVGVYNYIDGNYKENIDAEKNIKSNINYIIKADATENGKTSSNGKIVLTSDSTLGEVTIGDKTYKTANQDQKIIINVETVKGYKSTVQNNGTGTLTVNADGTYTLTIPEGGGVDLRAVLEKIEEQRKDNSTRNSDRYSSGGSSGGASGGSQGGSAIIYAPETGALGAGTQAADASWIYDNAGWKLKKSDGNYANSEWRELSWNGITNWYHFNSNGYADGGWYTDTDGHKYYFYNAHDGGFGHMLTGWNEIDGKWYYFNTANTAATPLGSLLTSGTTPDGYQVNADGAWVQ